VEGPPSDSRHCHRRASATAARGRMMSSSHTHPNVRSSCFATRTGRSRGHAFRGHQTSPNVRSSCFAIRAGRSGRLGVVGWHGHRGRWAGWGSGAGPEGLPAGWSAEPSQTSTTASFARHSATQCTLWRLLGPIVHTKLVSNTHLFLANFGAGRRGRRAAGRRRGGGRCWTSDGSLLGRLESRRDGPMGALVGRGSPAGATRR